MRGNYAHDNWGSGLHTDIDNVNTLYENNRSENNAQIGIFHEIGYKAIIRNNVTRGNGYASGWVAGAGIFVNSSQDVEIYGNTVSGISAELRHPRPTPRHTRFLELRCSG